MVIDHYPNAKLPDDRAAREAYLVSLEELGKRPQVYIKLSEVAKTVGDKVSGDLSAYNYKLGPAVTVMHRSSTQTTVHWRKTMSRGRMPTVVLAFFMIDLALGVAYVLNYLADRPYWKLTSFLDLDQEGNLPTWYASMKWFCVATLLGIFALRNFRLSQSKSWPLMLLPLVFLALSLDEVAQIHEWMGRRSDVYLPNASRANTLFSKTGIWMFVVGLPFVAFVVLLIRSVRTYFQRASGALVKICLGIVIMLTGAIGIETLSNFVTPNSVYAVLQVFSEELCEMLGSTVVFWGSYELLYRHGFAFRLERVDADGMA